MTKEQVYDEQVFPLMKEILAICKDNKIAMVASFAIPNDDAPDLQCTSALLDECYLEGLPKGERNAYLGALSMLKDGFVAWSQRVR